MPVESSSKLKLMLLLSLLSGVDDYEDLMDDTSTQYARLNSASDCSPMHTQCLALLMRP